MSPCRNDYITVSILETPPVSIPLGTYANRYPLSPWVLSLVDEPSPLPSGKKVWLRIVSERVSRN